MANYRSMYAVLCKAIDDAITPLEAIPQAEHIVADLRSVLLEAEEIYITTATEIAPGKHDGILKLRRGVDKGTE